jgi:hypothetical protein
MNKNILINRPPAGLDLNNISFNCLNLNDPNKIEYIINDYYFNKINDRISLSYS